MRTATFAFINEWKAWIQVAEVLITLASIIVSLIHFKDARLHDGLGTAIMDATGLGLATWFILHVLAVALPLMFGWFLFLFDS